MNREPTRTVPGRGALPWGAPLVVAVCLLAAPAAARGQGADRGSAAAGPADTVPRIEVTDVDFPGARSLGDALLVSAVATVATRCASPLFIPACVLTDWDRVHVRGWLDPAEARRDEERLALLYEAWGYPDARIEARWDTAAKTVVRYRVEEGEPLRVVALEVRGLDRVEPAIELPPRLPLEPGDPYALPRLAGIEAWLKDRLAERGHPFGAVSYSGEVDEADRTARLVIEVEPGPPAVFGPARIQAEPPLDPATVRAMLRFEPGAPYDLERLYATERALYLLPIVQRAILQPAVAAAPPAAGPGAADTVVVPVDVRVVPREATATEVEGTLTSTECLTLAVYRHDRHFLGAPRLLGVGAGVTHLGAGPLDGAFPCTSAGDGPYAEPQLFAEARLRQPWPGRPATQLELGLATRRSAAPGVYVLRRQSATVAASHDFGAGLVALARWAPSRNDLSASDAYFCGSYGVCTRAGTDALAGPSWLSPLEALVTWTPTGEPRQTVAPEELDAMALWGPLPWHYWLQAGVEGAARWTGSDWRYARARVEGAVARPFGTRAELAAHARAAWTGGSTILPPFLRNYAGGLYSVRGYAQDMLGPATLVTTAERAAALGCDPACPAGLTVPPGPVSVRPTGGDRVVEASLEGRLWVASRIQLAAFVDVGAIHRDPLRIDGTTALAGGWTARVTPGIGMRVLGNLGPVRVDLGYDASGPRPYPLFASEDGALGFRGTPLYDPFTHDDPSGFRELTRRLQLHVGFGQPF